MNVNLNKKQNANEQLHQQMAATILELAHKQYRRSQNNSTIAANKSESEQNESNLSSVKYESFQDKLKLSFFKRQSS